MVDWKVVDISLKGDLNHIEGGERFERVKSTFTGQWGLGWVIGTLWASTDFSLYPAVGGLNLDNKTVFDSSLL